MPEVVQFQLVTTASAEVTHAPDYVEPAEEADEETEDKQ